MTFPKATRKEWFGLIALALPCLVYSMDLTVLNLALPMLSEELKPTSPQLLWIFDIYGFLVAGFLITMGTTGDRIGRRKLLMFGATFFGAASLLAAFAPTANALIIARAVLGISGATIAPSTLSLIRNMFLDEKERMFAISIWGTSYAAGGVVGPIVGGLLLEYFWWGSVFLIGVPVMVLLLLVGPRVLPEFKDPTAGKQDLVSVFLSLVSVLAMIYGLKVAATLGFGREALGLPLLATLVGLVMGVLFIRRQAKLSLTGSPMIDLSLFKAPAFSTALLTNVCGAFILFGSFFFVSQYLQLVRGLSPIQSSLWMVPSSVVVIVNGMFTPVYVRLMRPAYVIAAGMGLTALGFAILTQLGPESSAWLYISGSIIYGLGISPVFPLTTEIIMSAAPPEKAGAASAVSETCAELGGALGVAVLGSVGTAIYRTEMLRVEVAMDDVGLGATVRDSIGGAVAVAEKLPVDVAATVLNQARNAFTRGFSATLVIGAVIALTLAIVVVRVLKDFRTSHNA